MQAFAGAEAKLENWDVSYWSEKLRQQKYSVDDESIKPYLPLPKVLAGMYALAETLFGVTIKESTAYETWQDDVMTFDVTSTDTGAPLAKFFLDPYARPADKRGGAWMNSAVGRSRALAALGEDVMLPVCYLVCNQSPPVGGQPSLMTFNEAETLFHEFGHGLQHMITTVDNGAVSGINGVEWDAVELPSQVHSIGSSVRLSPRGRVSASCS
jgi:oligopeptidase A